MKVGLCLLLFTLAASVDKRPKSVNEDLYCIACQGIVRETLRRLHGRTKQSEVIAVMEDLCDLWKYKTYDYPPPEMARGCNAILGNFEEELEWALTHRNELKEDVETYFCHRKIEACPDPSESPASPDQKSTVSSQGGSGSTGESPSGEL